MTIPLRPQPGIYAEADNSKAVSTSSTIPKRLLILGGLLPTGTATAGVPVRVLSGNDAAKKFGLGSILSRMVRAGFKAAPNLEIWGLPLDEAGAPSTGTLSLCGTAAQGDLVQLEIGGQRVVIILPMGNVANALSATAALTCLNGGTDATIVDQPYFAVKTTAIETSQTVLFTITAKNPGANGALNIRLAPDCAQPANIAIEIETMSGGSSAISFTNLPSMITERWFPTLASPWTDTKSMSDMESELLRRGGALVGLPSQAFVAVAGTSAQLDSWVSHHNCQFVTAFAAGNNLRASAWELAAIAAAIDCNEDIPNRPRQSLPLTGFIPPLVEDQYTATERNILLGQGLATYSLDSSDIPIIERLVTTYTHGREGAPDPSYQDTETMRALTYLLISWKTRMRLRYPRNRLVDDGTRTTAKDVVTPSMIAIETLALFGEWERDGYVEDFKTFKDNLRVVRDPNSRNRVNLNLSPNIANMLQTLAATFDFLL